MTGAIQSVPSMQILGLSDSTPRSESRLRALFWPSIRNDGDFDYITRQGFWICFIIAAITLILSAFSASPLSGLFEAAFFFLAGIGVRERSRVAGITAFAGYLLSGLVLQRYTGQGFGILRIVFLALLLANVRGNLLAAGWKHDPENDVPLIKLNTTIGDKLVDQMPSVIWPKARFVFYVLASIEILLLFIALFAPAGRR
jgi:hypothetical protein